jgi:hypothetical protein
MEELARPEAVGWVAVLPLRHPAGDRQRFTVVLPVRHPRAGRPMAALAAGAAARETPSAGR